MSYGNKYAATMKIMVSRVTIYRKVNYTHTEGKEHMLP